MPRSKAVAQLTQALREDARQDRAAIRHKVAALKAQTKAARVSYLGQNLRQPSAGGTIYGSQYTDAERPLLDELAAQLVAEIDEAATEHGTEAFTRFDAMKRWAELLEEEGLPPHPDPFGKAGQNFARRLMHRHGCCPLGPAQPAKTSAAECAMGIRQAWRDFRAVLERAEAAALQLRQMGTPAEVGPKIYTAGVRAL
jgi:hypothetical protein